MRRCYVHDTSDSGETRSRVATVSTIEHRSAREWLLGHLEPTRPGGLFALGALAAVGWTVSLGPLAPAPVPSRPDPIAMVAGQVTRRARDRPCTRRVARRATGHRARGRATARPSGTWAPPRSTSCSGPGGCRSRAPGAPVQRGKPAFNDAEIKALVALRRRRSGRARPSRTSRSRARRISPPGRAAYTATCAACHGAGASGDAVGGGSVAPPLLGTATDPGRRGDPHGAGRDAGVRRAPDLR